MHPIRPNHVFNSSQTILMATKHQTHEIKPKQVGKRNKTVNPNFPLPGKG